jgi:glutathione synthase/RimK-type ligase-like ATP-grasp enzyme
MSILIIGSPDEAHASFMVGKLQARGETPVYFDTRLFPSRDLIALVPDALEKSRFKCPAQGVEVSLADLKSVYWRFHFGYQFPPMKDQFLLDMAHRETDSAIGSMLRMLSCPVINSPEAIAQHAYKTYQLHLLRRAGLRVPETLVSNDPDEVLAFWERLNGRVIFKPVRGGAHTAKLKPDDLKPDRLKELSKSPVQFQELVEGVDVRVYWMAGEAFAAEIQSKTLDFRDDPKAAIVPVELPEAIQRDCGILARTLGLVYSGIDVRRTPEGEYVFLEGNPCPMFIHFERQTGYPISDRLADLLTGVIKPSG